MSLTLKIHMPYFCFFLWILNTLILYDKAFYILLKGLFLSFTMTELFIHLRSVCLSGNQNSLLLLRFRGETVEPDTRLLATNGIPLSPLSSSARCCKELSK